MIQVNCRNDTVNHWNDTGKLQVNYRYDTVSYRDNTVNYRYDTGKIVDKSRIL